MPLFQSPSNYCYKPGEESTRALKYGLPLFLLIAAVERVLFLEEFYRGDTVKITLNFKNKLLYQERKHIVCGYCFIQYGPSYAYGQGNRHWPINLDLGTENVSYKHSSDPGWEVETWPR